MNEGDNLLLETAIELFIQGRLSSGAAAQLVDMPKPLFLTKLGDYDVSTFCLTEEELRRDLENA